MPVGCNAAVDRTVGPASACDGVCVARLVYIDETGSVGRAGKGQAYLTVVAAIIDESMVQPLRQGLFETAMRHLGWVPEGFEFHGQEIWNGTGHWSGKTPEQLLAAYADVLRLLDQCDVDLAYASIHKANLHVRYDGGADENAYRLALQFLLEKIDTYSPALKVVIADEAKEQQLRAVAMLQQMQEWSWGGEVPGRQLRTIIDSLHFVPSHQSAGVQMADLVGFVLQRSRRREPHANAQARRDEMMAMVNDHVRTWREPWP